MVLPPQEPLPGAALPEPHAPLMPGTGQIAQRKHIMLGSSARTNPGSNPVMTRASRREGPIDLHHRGYFSSHLLSAAPSLSDSRFGSLLQDRSMDAAFV